MDTVGNKRRGIRWTITSMLEDLEFADDIALISSNSGYMQRKTVDPSKYAKQVELNIYKKNTKTLSPVVKTVEH